MTRAALRGRCAWAWALLVLLAGSPGAPAAILQVVDDTGTVVQLARPAQRIVSLAPHVTELLFAAGAGHQVVAVSRFSSYPAAAAALPQVGDVAHTDLERVLALRPDLVVGWGSALPAALQQRLRASRIAVFSSQPASLEDIATSIERLGLLAGTGEEARRAAAALRTQVAQLHARSAGRVPVPVFFQAWANPLMTLTGAQPVLELIRLCGGAPLFAQSRLLASTIDPEAVIAANPALILSAGTAADGPRIFARWLGLPALRAVAGQHLLLLDGDRLSRPTPRLLDLAPALCAAIEAARPAR